MPTARRGKTAAAVGALFATASLAASARKIVKRENTELETSRYDIRRDDIPRELDGMRIAHISDLHNADLGDGNAEIIAQIRAFEPNLIAITGDLIETSSHLNSLHLVEQLAKIAPTVSVSGNHDRKSPYHDAWLELQRRAGAIPLENEVRKIPITPKGTAVRIIGLADPGVETGKRRMLGETSITNRDVIEEHLKELIEKSDSSDALTIALCHRPEHLPLYAEHNLPIILAGHAHGGQWRLPRVGGLYSPHQGILPKWTAGICRMGETDMIVSRGLGNSSFPIRLNNKPELVLITLHCR